MIKKFTNVLIRHLAIIAFHLDIDKTKNRNISHENNAGLRRGRRKLEFWPCTFLVLIFKVVLQPTLYSTPPMG